MALAVARRNAAAPVVHRTVRSQKGTGPLIASDDDLEDILGSGGREFAHAQIIDDEKGHGGCEGSVSHRRNEICTNRIAFALESQR